MKNRLYITTLILIFSGLSLPYKVNANEKAGNFSIGLNSEQLGVNTIGIEAGYFLPFDWVRNLKIGAGYNTNRPYTFISPNGLPVDYITLKAQYFIPVNDWLEPYAGIKGRMGNVGINTITYPDLSRLDTLSFSAGLNLGAAFILGENLSLFIDLTGNYPASFAFPFLSWGFGVNYHF